MVKDDLVFIIDDDLILNEVHRILFNKVYPDITLKTFTTAQEAIQAIDNNEIPSTVFLDLHMPRERDTAFLDAHKSRNLTSDIYLLSSMVYFNDPQLLSTYPAIRDFINKPLLKHKIEAVFNHYV